MGFNGFAGGCPRLLSGRLGLGNSWIDRAVGLGGLWGRAFGVGVGIA